MPTAHSPLLVCLPVADRRRGHEFYQQVLGLEAIGEPADDGVPEPLLFVVNAGVRLMLIPTVGFGWVVGDHDVAPPGSSECVLGIGAASDAEVEEIVGRAARRGRPSPPTRRPSRGATRPPFPTRTATSGR